MAKIRVGINGFGRIGRNFFRAHLQRGGDFEIVAANDLGDPKTMAHLLRYDSTLGPLGEEVSLGEDTLRAGDFELKLLSERDPAALSWGELGVDVVLDSTGFFTDRDGARAAAINLIPTATGAAKAIGLVLPELQGKLDGVAVRAPVATGSVTDLVARLSQDVTRDEVVGAYREAAGGPLGRYMQFSEDPLVSTDIVHSPYSCIYDSELTMANGSLVKVFGWYDNEWGYSCRLVDLIAMIGATLPVEAATV